MDSVLGPQDVEQIEAHGLTVEAVHEQISRFERGAPYADLDRPCAIGDGIRQFDAAERDHYIRIFEKSGRRRGLTKFVPASGAATRMFQALLKISTARPSIRKSEIIALSKEEESEFEEAHTFIENLHKFAFYDALAELLREQGKDINVILSNGNCKEIFDCLLTESGLSYAGYPKGLILFHKYPEGARTAFEEHLVEAATYAKDDRNVCSVHFTVSPEHQARFEALLERLRVEYEARYDAIFEVSFSVQSKSTDTIAVDENNRPYRDENGELHFRPAGHGALIENLNRIGGDIIFIKNVDNVVPDRLKATNMPWKKALAGYLITLSDRISDALNRLIDGPVDGDLVSEIMYWAPRELCAEVPGHIPEAPIAEQREYLIHLLDRPLRVCGMVPSTGDPGGGPFWVKQKDGTRSIQIVENAQIDPASPQQRAVLKKLTHFNPVDIFAAVRDRHGQAYFLPDFVDPDAFFISKKFKDGHPVKSLELPGLWNGGMAQWNTVFVEVPGAMFNPVKTVNDLLRENHQA